MSRKKLFILDVLPIIYRAHFAMINQSLYNSSGINTSPILGFCNYLFQILFKEQPTHIAAAFDSGSIERKAMMKSYKATREKVPEDISIAIDYVRKFLETLNIKKIEMQGFEADDVIGTIAAKAAQEKFDVYIVSPDKDLAQMVDNTIFLYRPPYQGTNFEILDASKVEEKYGVPPSQIADYLALKGDTADNIPGVPKIGEKTAVDLLKTFGSVEQVLAHKNEITKASIRETLNTNEELAILSKKTAIINFKLPLEFNQDQFLFQSPDFESLDNLLIELEFKKLKERIFSHPLYKDFSKNNDNNNSKKVHNNSFTKIKVSDDFDLQRIVERINEKFVFQLIEEDGNLNLYFISDNKVYFYKCEHKIPEPFQAIVGNPNKIKITFDLKSFYRKAIKFKLKLKGGFHDVMLQHYVLNPEGSHQLDSIVNQNFSDIVVPEGTLDKNCFYTNFLSEINQILIEELEKKDLIKLYNDVEIPLANVLAMMEENGIGIDLNVLKEIASLLQKRTKELEQKMQKIAGEEVNVRSSKQMADLLSKIVKSESFKKTKGGQFSTAEDNLKELADEYEIAGLLLSFRKLDKVVSTYALSLPKYISKETGRIHADFKQALTATGRLSCANPNLQNLPILTEEGREIRKSVIPISDEYTILAADYSQIELRLLAALSGDKALTNAFAENKDVHTITAAKVFKVAENEVTSTMRSKAKMVNYGIAYGISPFGLGQNLKIKQTEAKEIIDSYFSEFPSIKKFIDQCISYAKEKGYTQTKLGRRRYLPEINSRNGTVRKMAERIAINAPIQGLAADLIKVAMINLQKFIDDNKLKSKMIMQIHDELVFEVHKEELQIMKQIVHHAMENAIDLPVPLDVNISVGNNWLELDDLL